MFAAVRTVDGYFQAEIFMSTLYHLHGSGVNWIVVNHFFICVVQEKMTKVFVVKVCFPTRHLL